MIHTHVSGENFTVKILRKKYYYVKFTFARFIVKGNFIYSLLKLKYLYYYIQIINYALFYYSLTYASEYLNNYIFTKQYY